MGTETEFVVNFDRVICPLNRILSEQYTPFDPQALNTQIRENPGVIMLLPDQLFALVEYIWYSAPRTPT